MEQVALRRVPLQPADASVGGVLQRPLSTGATLLQRARVALLHPVQGTGLLQWQVATVLSEDTGARTARGRAHGSTARLPFRPARKRRPGQVEKFQRESCAACRDEVWCGRCSGRRCIWPARCGPCAGAGHGFSSRSLPMSFAHVVASFYL